MTTSSFTGAQAAVLDRHGIEAEARFVDAPVVEGRAQVLIAGEGPPIVLVNGIGTPAAMWAPLMARLRGFTLHAVDLPGYGLTDTTPNLADDLRVAAVRFLTEILDELGLDQPVFVGNSLGSLWASWLALDRPDRTSALVHVGCPAVVLDTSAPLPMRLLSVRGLGRLMMKLQPPSSGQVRRLSKMVNEYPLPDEIADLLLATEQLPGFERTFLATLNTLVRLGGSRPEVALTEDQLGRIEQPTLLVFGADDPMGAAPVGERVAAALPDAALHVVEGGHAPWLGQSEHIGRLISEFVRTVTTWEVAP